MDEPVQDRLTQAIAARQAGRYTDALALLAGSEDWPSALAERGTILRAQILARKDPIGALELLAHAHDLFATPEARFDYYVASMRAYIGARNYESAFAMSERAEELDAHASVPGRTAFRHFRALLRYCLEQYDPQDRDIITLIESNDPNSRFIGLLMRGYMQAGLGRFAEQAADLGASLDVATANPGACDPGIVALQIHGLLRIGLETGDRAAVATATRAYDWLSWTDDLRSEQFLCVRALAWDAFLRGESAQAQWLLRDSKAMADNDAWRVMAHLDRAYIARMNGNEHWAADELLAAHALARHVEWSATRGEERQALVTLAVLFSPTNMAQAQHYVSLYVQLGRNTVNPGISVSNDRRSTAFEKYALGRVQQVLGNNSLAISAFETAYEIFSPANYHFRASLAAIGLFETTRDTTWLERARKHAAVFPQSALSTTLREENRVAEDERLRQLTPMQRQLALALCEGLDLAELSQRFSRSAYTLEQHVDVIYARLGVTNRRELRTALQEWRIV
jgi:DNA-binding CsgD family transcriptional regulator